MAARVGPATLALIAGSWVVARRQMHGLDVGAATAPGARRPTQLVPPPRRIRRGMAERGRISTK